MWVRFEETIVEIKNRLGAPAELTKRELLEALLYPACTGAL